MFLRAHDQQSESLKDGQHNLKYPSVLPNPYFKFSGHTRICFPLRKRHHVSGKQDTEDRLFSIIAQSNCMDFKWNRRRKIKIIQHSSILSQSAWNRFSPISGTMEIFTVNPVKIFWNKSQATSRLAKGRSKQFHHWWGKNPKQLKALKTYTFYSKKLPFRTTFGDLASSLCWLPKGIQVSRWVWAPCGSSQLLPPSLSRAWSTPARPADQAGQWRELPCLKN